MTVTETTPVPPPVRLHPVVPGLDWASDQVALASARSLLRVRTRAEVAEVLRAAVVDLGGVVVPAREGRQGVLPVDVSLGVGEASVVLPCGPADEARLSQVLPALVEDALVAAARCDSYAYEAWRASVDELTGVANRREIMPRVRAARPGDVVCILDLDHFKAINDAEGHVAGDEVLRRFGQVLGGGTRAQDFVGRVGGDEFVVVMSQTRLPVAVRRLEEIAEQWSSHRQGRSTFSAGAARVDERGGLVAIDAADRALYLAKQSGRGSVRTSVTPTRTDGGS